MRLLDYTMEYVSMVRKLITHNINGLEGRTPMEYVTGDTSDISDLAYYSHYEPVFYYDPSDFPQENRLLGRWLLPAVNVGQALCYWILTKSGYVVARSTVQPLTKSEKHDSIVTKQIEDFDKSVAERISTVEDANFPDNESIEQPAEGKEFPPEAEDDINNNDNNNNNNNNNENNVSEETENNANNDNTNSDDEIEMSDEYLNVEVLRPIGDEVKQARVVARKRDAEGRKIGKHNNNPLLDTREYIIEFPDGERDELSANIIAENKFIRTDNEGNEYVIFKDIIGHKIDERIAVSKDEGWTDSGNRRRMKRTTKGVWLEVKWNGNNTSWLPLAFLKEANPIEVANYTVANQLVEWLAFRWWVPQVLRRAKRTIAKAKRRQQRCGYKFGIKISRTVEEALQIDKDTGTSFWEDAIKLEMKNVLVAFDIKEDGSIPVAHKLIKVHMVFDIKMDFTRKARLVADGHLTDTPSSVTYSSVVSRESVRIAFLIAALNDLDVQMADVGNAYLNAKCREKVYFIAGIEFGQHKGKIVRVVSVLYGLKSSGAAWRSHFTQVLTDMGFKSCHADNDVWMRVNTKPCGFKYYKYILVYVDDFLMIIHNTDSIINAIKSVPFKLKDVGPPKRYLGASISTYQLGKKKFWSMSADQYIKNALIAIKEKYILDSKRVTTPMSSGYRPEVDTSELLNDDDANYYQSLIGILRWAVELGHIDIAIEVGMLSTFMCSPREGHLQQVLHMFAYLDKHKRSRVVFDSDIIDFSD